ncbi:hypothetical protein L486_02323 [Kwoniella mangroviensis CBS 10435]|uniref:Uncharacterized protein n=1 Tax=Kwoniella mangroviensis CBS 10435 TaxID=1331196 RepID=A0A1B9IVU4_9TREE|nr:hypothetical protein L486_02323 [Kwoniella mangroviensis CBS 10435]
MSSSFKPPSSPVPPRDHDQEDQSEGITVTSHDHPISHSHSHTSSQTQQTSRRRASTLIVQNHTHQGSKLFPVDPSNNSEDAKPSTHPIRPPKSPLRPRFPSIRKRSHSTDSGAGAESGDRRRQNSELSIGGLEYLRGILSNFRQSLRNNLLEEKKQSSEEEKVKEEGSVIQEKESRDTLEKRKRSSSGTLSGFFNHQAHSRTRSRSRSRSLYERISNNTSDMSLSDQRSTQRLINEFMEDLTPRSPTGSFHSLSQPQRTTPPVPRHPHVDRVKRAGGHRRTLSSPNPIPRVSTDSTNNESQSERGRTLSGGTFGKPLGSDGLLSDIETLKSGRFINDGTASAPISPALTTTSLPLPPVQLPFIMARRSNRSPEPSVHLQPPSSPKIFPALPLSSPPPLSSPENAILTPLMGSPPLTTPPTTNTALLPLPPLTSPLPALPSPPHTPSRQSSIRVVSPDTHPFAAVVAMMEAGDSPTKRRSRNQMAKESQEVLDSPRSTKKDKGKERDEGERPFGSQGRKQTPRRGFIGPGGIIPRMPSRTSLTKLKITPIPKASKDTISQPNPVIVSIPPSPPDTAKPFPTPTPSRPPKTVSVLAEPITPTSTTYLRPAPATTLTPFWSKPRFAVSSASPSNGRNQSPDPSSISRQGTPIPIYAPRSGADGLPPGPGSELVEIPRFKKKELNLGIVRRRGWGQRLAWLGLWIIWLVNGLLSLFFDVNVIYILVHSKSWQFATAAYGVLWAISTMVIWVGWEVGYEFWRRWRLPRPAVEPIYSSLPACLHLSLISFNHFTFLLHIRTSPLGTPYSRDIIPETCHALIQLVPGLLPLLPRAAIAVVVLISFWAPAADVQAPYGGAVDETSLRDSNFFRSDSPGELTRYAKGILLTFTVWIALRLVVVIASGIGLWVNSGRPLGGLIGHRLSRRKKVSTGAPTTPRKPKSSLQPRDPSTTSSPQKSWVDQENEFDWAWRERTRSRIQDAFELCMIRRNNDNNGLGRLNSFLYQSEIPWGRMIDREERRPEPKKKVKKPISTGEFIDRFVEGKDLPSVTTTPEKKPARPESTTLIDLHAHSHPQDKIHIHPSPSRVNTAASSSATDLFYTPFEGNTPQTEKTSSVAEGIHKLPQISPSPGGRAPPPPSAYRPAPTVGELSEFGVKEREGRGSPDSGSGEGDDESTGLLTNSLANSTTASPRNSILSKHASTRNRSQSTTSSKSGSNDQSTSSRSSSFNRRTRAYTTNGSPSKDSLRRTRSSSITLLRESVANAANASGHLIRRARSGTVLSSESKYSRMDDERGSGEEGEEEEILDHGKVTPRSRRGTGLGLGLPFAINEKTAI